MKLGRIWRTGPDGQMARIVAVRPDEGRVIDLARAEALRLERRGATPDAARRLAGAIFGSSMSAAIAMGTLFPETAALAAEEAGDDASLPLEEATWLAALDPPVIRDSLTFPLHMKQFGERLGVGPPNPQFFKTPGYFKGSTGVVYGHEETIPFPAFAQDVDYELELGYVIGGRGRNLTPDQAAELIFGLTIFNDFSARDIQAREMGMGMGPQKCKDFAYGIGPWITTLDDPDLPPLDQLTMTVRVNGAEWATGVSEGVIYTGAELAAYVSIGDWLQPGDIIGSGTVGNGSALELGRHLDPGDVVELELEGVGVLRNRFTEEPEDYPWWPEPRPNPFETAATGAAS
jgi:2-keto-4-pentenoate hydratase/2-oxohepta-3-ene-1,7-dioic acid hydratase in catechol pathway